MAAHISTGAFDLLAAAFQALLTKEQQAAWAEAEAERATARLSYALGAPTEPVSLELAE